MGGGGGNDQGPFQNLGEESELGARGGGGSLIFLTARICNSTTTSRGIVPCVGERTGMKRSFRAEPRTDLS